MEHRPSTPLFDPELQAALHAELAAAASIPALRTLVLHPQPDLGRRFVGYWRQLSALPRRTRRSLQRRWKRSLAAIALLLALGQVPAVAATLAVAPGVAPAINPDGSCSLIEAIENANTDARTHADCPSGSGADTIVLPASSTQTLTQVHTYGYNGLPVVGSAITIEGNGSTIMRVGGGTPLTFFRIFSVNGTGNLTLKDTTVSRGGAISGGGVLNRGILTLMNSTVSGNDADVGGGVRNTGTLTLTNSTVSGNFASVIPGGGGLSNSSTATLTNSTVSGNTAIASGGGGVENSGTLTLINSTVSGNLADFLGSTVSGNLADFSSVIGGGGVNNSGTLTLSNSTVSGNSARYGGGVNNSGTLTLKQALVSGNTAITRGREVDNALPAGNIIANAFNLFGLNGAAGVSGFSPGPKDIVPAGPLGAILAPLADNGGPTETHALVAGSPAADAVKRGCPPPFTDQRGFARPADGDGDGGAKCDVGAFELAAQPLPTCETAQPTRGCTVNGVANRLCRGTARGDQIFGTHRDDIIFGLDGNDRINGLSGHDLICGGNGKDILRGKQGRDRVFGGAGDDHLQGGGGNDHLSGEGGNDLLLGDRGDDALDGGADTDKCHGGANGPAGDTATNCETVFGVP